jgi:hypothetical protein
LSNRLSKVPQQGLPPLVIDQLQLVNKTWERLQELANDPRPDQVLASAFVYKDEKVLRQLLRLNELLLQEVPLPVGCSNPACLDLSGDAEVKVSKKACTACKAVCYCSSECQAAHWEAHKGLCKMLRKASRA